MAKKNITFRIEDTLIAKLNELRGNKSQNTFLEDLITNFTSTSTSTSNPQSEVTLQLQLLVQAQAQLQALVQVQAKPEIKEVKVYLDEDGNVLNEVVDEVPEELKRKLTPEEIYGKVTTYEKGEFDHDPLRYLDDEDDKPQPKQDKREIERLKEQYKDFNPFK